MNNPTPEKSAEEWDNIWKQNVEAWTFNLRRPPQDLDNVFREWIRSIQRNAKHAAMLEAAEIIRPRVMYGDVQAQYILTAAEKYKD